MTAGQALQQAVQHHQAGRLVEAASLYRQVLSMTPEQTDALHGLGLIAYQIGDLAVAERSVRESIRLADRVPHYHRNLGNILRTMGRIEDAIGAYMRAVELAPHEVQGLVNLGSALEAAGRLSEAEDCYRRAMAVHPDLPEAQYNLAQVLDCQGRMDEAIAGYERVLALRPDWVEVRNNLGAVLHRAAMPEESAANLRQVISRRPGLASAHHNLACALQDQGRIEEAIDEYRAALAADPSLHDSWVNLLFGLHFDPRVDARAIRDDHGRWAQRFAEPLKAGMRPHLRERGSGGRLRIGYVSPDFRNHPIGLLIEPMLENHDRTRFEVFCYSNTARDDAVTARLRSHADAWKRIEALTDDQAAELIRHDRIDILVDLACHTVGNRLLVFARKPAPVQVNYLGYPGTSGLSAMDYRFTTQDLDPPGSAAYPSTEQLVYPSSAFWCYSEPANSPEPAAPPIQKRGHVTFGSLNKFMKVNGQVIRLWSRILHQVPGSRLALLVKGGTRQMGWVSRLFGEHGIDPERLVLWDYRPREEYLAMFNGLDVSLDPFPYNGHTTTLDSLWMGVPTVTLEGKLPVGRAGVSHLRNLGLQELIGRTEDEYVRLAVELAQDAGKLSELRTTLRQRMRASAVMDARGFTRAVEGAYERIWRI